MDSRRPAGRPRRPSHPNTLGEAWRRANGPRRRKADNLPPLPDWPPLRGERLEDRALPDWPSLGPSPSVGGRSSPRNRLGAGYDEAEDVYEHDGEHDAEHGAEHGATHDSAPWPASWPQPGEPLASDARQPTWAFWRRWRGASRRTRVAIVAAIVLPLLLIAGCSSLTLSALNNLTLGASSSLLGGQTTQSAQSATQQASALTGTPAAATATHAASVATSAPTSAPTRAATSTPNQTLTLTITCASGSLRGTGTVCAQTLPSASLSLTVRYCDGTDAKGLHGSATASSTGAYTWTWPVRTTCAGAATATVTAQWQGKTVTASKTFTITP